MRDLLSVLPTDRGFQNGLRLAMFGPAITMLGGLAVLSVRGDAEAGVGWGILHIAAFSVLQWVWIAPVALVSIGVGRRRFALGAVVGGAFLLVANGLAWFIGLTIGAR